MRLCSSPPPMAAISSISFSCSLRPAKLLPSAMTEGPSVQHGARGRPPRTLGSERDHQTCGGIGWRRRRPGGSLGQRRRRRPIGSRRVQPPIETLTSTERLSSGTAHESTADGRSRRRCPSSHRSARGLAQPANRAAARAWRRVPARPVRPGNCCRLTAGPASKPLVQPRVSPSGVRWL